MIVARSPRSCGCDFKSEKNCTPAGSCDTNTSRATRAASALSVAASRSTMLLREAPEDPTELLLLVAEREVH
jgi:hypothetical protein